MASFKCSGCGRTDFFTSHGFAKHGKKCARKGVRSAMAPIRESNRARANLDWLEKGGPRPSSSAVSLPFRRVISRRTKSGKLVPIVDDVIHTFEVRHYRSGKLKGTVRAPLEPYEARYEKAQQVFRLRDDEIEFWTVEPA